MADLTSDIVAVGATLTDPEASSQRALGSSAPIGPTLVPMLTAPQELFLRLLTFGWCASSLWFWLWWTAAARGPWNVGRVIATVALAWVFLLGGYFLFFACRMTRPNPQVAVPRLRAAIVVTKAPSEPWAVVRRTLDAMLAQRFPYPYDVWLADEKPTAEVLAWCRDHDVHVSSRADDPAYHQSTWPRRTRCKEGNLAYFYDHYGYDRYDVVAQLDADHVPAPGYLEAMVRPFADPRVGYVGAPSICDANAEAGWTVRGRLHREASLHGPVQAGSNGGWAPLCIGSHYAVRTAALREVGGIGPDLAEDYSTTLFLQSAGWDGVFAIDAEAHGDGPETLQDMLTQELQWSRSLGTILVRWAPARFRTVPRRARARLSFALLFYPLQGLLCALGTMLPTLGVVTQTTWAQAPFLAFYLRLWLCSLFLFAAVGFLRRRQVLRPTDAKLWSWEMFLFQVIRWPWTAWGFAQGMWSGRRSVPKGFKVTPKGARQRTRLRVRLLFPTLVLGLIPALAVLIVHHPGRALGMYILAVAQAVLYVGAALCVVVLHIWSQRHPAGQTPTA